MKKRIGADGFRIIEAWLRREALRRRRSQPLSAAGLVQAACIDGTDLPAWSSRDPHNTKQGLGDPDARVGRGKKGFLLGYQSLFLVDIEGFPLGHVEAPLNVNEKQLVEELLRARSIDARAVSEKRKNPIREKYMKNRRNPTARGWKNLGNHTRIGKEPENAGIHPRARFIDVFRKLLVRTCRRILC